MRWHWQIIVFFILICSFGCQPVEYGNVCDSRSRTFLDTLLFKIVSNLRSPHCGINVDLQLSPIKPLYTGRNQLLDYIKNDGSSAITASNTSCTGLELGGYSACLHAGLMLSIEANGGIFNSISCDGYFAEDNTGTLQFTCFEKEGGGLVFVATSIKPGKYLGDLVVAEGGSYRFGSLSVSVFNANQLVGKTQFANTWTNSILSYPLVGGTLNNVGTLYLLDQSSASLGAADIVSDRTGILFKSNVSLTIAATSPFFRFSGKFQYLEGEFGSPSNVNPLVSITETNRFMWSPNLMATVGGATFSVQGSQGLYQSIRVSTQNSGNVVSLSSAGMSVGSFIQNNTFSSITAGDIDGSSISLASGGTNNHIWNNSFLDAVLYSSTDEGIAISTSSSNIGGNVFKDMVAANSSTNATISVFETLPAKISGLTISNQILVNMVSGIGLLSSGSSDFKMLLENIGIFGASNYAIENSSVNNQYLTGNIRYSNNLSNNILSGTNIGFLVNGLPAGTSDYNFANNIPYESSFVGFIFQDDIANPNDNAGFVPIYLRNTSYLKFQNTYRSFTNYDPLGVFTDNVKGICSGNCRIFDWSLKKSDTYFKNTNVCPDSSRPLLHTVGGVATSESDCQNLVRGSKYLGSNVCGIYHLRNAREIIGDAKGNENGLCESNEDCLFTPNLGAYQGHGILRKAYSIHPYYCQDIPKGDGNLSQIRLFGFEENGY
ncbi:hypothetical protein [Leptospira limi]|uniref:Right-handed parallel beta-helix repeat-containing protein n=1 Tax=Leptospira limi TaxID=2950023 RepID=A0ABT3M1H8_9LEPT|nr:hypothetical protein [Leptospira limi]MCW7463814.1 hypothetical protein [Leptospira limi]